MYQASQPWHHTGYGTLGLTWRPQIVPDEQAFPCIKAAIDNGATIFSTSSVYGPPGDPTAGLKLLARYFQKFPDEKAKVTLFIRSCFDAESFSPACDRDSVRASWEEADRIFRPVGKFIDVFGPARMSQDVPVEVTIGAMKELLDEGKIGGVGLSEVRAETIRRASAVCPILFSEVEFSMWEPEMLDNGVALAAKECNVALLCYYPLGAGFLTGAIKTLDDLPEDDRRRHTGRFQQENFDKNLALAKKLQDFAKTLGVTPAQLALSWIRAHSNKGVCGTVIPIPGATKVHRVEENCKAFNLSPEQKSDLDSILKTFTVAGERGIVGMSQKFILT